MKRDYEREASDTAIRLKHDAERTMFYCQGFVYGWCGRMHEEALMNVSYLVANSSSFLRGIRDGVRAAMKSMLMPGDEAHLKGVGSIDAIDDWTREDPDCADEVLRYLHDEDFPAWKTARRCLTAIHGAKVVPCTSK